MIKKFRILLLPALLICAFATAQESQNVKWKSEVKQLSEGNYRIVLTADIPARFHMYDMGPYSIMGPNATVITMTPESGAKLSGVVQQVTKPHRYIDDVYQMEIGTFEGKAEFAQDIQLTEPKATVKAMVEWMICDDTSCMPLTDEELIITIEGTPVAGVVADQTPAANVNAATNSATENVKASTDEVTQKDAVGGNKNLWGLIIEAILWGFAMLITPCVFPMVPMTVSFFMKGEGGAAAGRFRAAMYGFFIVVLYTLPIAALILITRVVGGDTVTADIFNWLSTHWLPNVIFFIVFMVFAASFFGAFEITLPSWMVNKSDSKVNNKSLGGIFFLALTLVLVSFSCTGPIVGSVLIKSTSGGGEFWTPIITMLAFSIAFALPFTLFAFFPSMLKKMPKSGGWLNSVKVVLGFIEVALGLKFLSVADQTYHWGILDREVYLAIWIVVFALMGLYLLGKIKFAHDSDMPYLGVGRLALAIITLSFVVYLIPGMWGAPLKAFSGYMPPMASQDYIVNAGGSTTASAETGFKTKYSDFLHLPHGLQGFFDLKEAEEYAASVNKPLFIDFTGHGCVNCREMETKVWSDPHVLSILRNDYVIVALYADDKKELPESDWITTDTGKVLKGLGKINSYYALKTYGVNAQPYYVLQGRDGKILVQPQGYNLNIESFANYLKSGVEAYKNQQ